MRKTKVREVANDLENVADWLDMAYKATKGDTKAREALRVIGNVEPEQAIENLIRSLGKLADKLQQEVTR